MAAKIDEKIFGMSAAIAGPATSVASAMVPIKNLRIKTPEWN